VRPPNEPKKKGDTLLATAAQGGVIERISERGEGRKRRPSLRVGEKRKKAISKKTEGGLVENKGKRDAAANFCKPSRKVEQAIPGGEKKVTCTCGIRKSGGHSKQGKEGALSKKKKEDRLSHEELGKTLKKKGGGMKEKREGGGSKPIPEKRKVPSF